MRNHYLAVMELLEADPLSAKAAALRRAIKRMEREDPTLIAEYVDLLAAHVRPIGAVPPAKREPAGVMLT